MAAKAGFPARGGVTVMGPPLYAAANSRTSTQACSPGNTNRFTRTTGPVISFKVSRRNGASLK